MRSQMRSETRKPPCKQIGLVRCQTIDHSSLAVHQRVVDAYFSRRHGPFGRQFTEVKAF